MKKFENLHLKSRFSGIILSLAFLFSSGGLFAQTGISPGYNPHDSLLFDGSPEVFIKKGGDKNCGWKVKHVWGTVIGTRDTAIRNEPNECDDMKEEFVRDVVSQVRSPLKEGDEIYDNDNLEMRGEAFIQLEMGYPKINTSETRLPENYPGFLIITVKCKNFKVPSCGPDTRWDYRNGSAPVWWEMKTLEKKYGPKFLFNANKSYSIQTDQCIIKNNGTIYSLEQTETDDIIKVYEGSVEITQIQADTSNLGGLMKLQEDYKNGKISTEEMVKKTIELQAQINEQNKYTSKPLTVEAGYQLTVSGGKIGEVVPVSADDDKWWDK